jgi:DNA-binding MarR family transcriptional regulator
MACEPDDMVSRALGYYVRIARIARSTTALAAQPGGLDHAGPALFRLVRFWSRRWAAQAADAAASDHALDIVVLEAIDAASTTGPVAIADVAVQLGLDRSGASRMVAAVASRGHVARRDAADDARRAALVITAPGRELLTAARVWQDQVFRGLVADWTAADARRFAHYLIRLADQELPTTHQQESRP